MSIDREKILDAAQKLVAKGRYDKAIVEYRKIIKEHPGDDRTMQRIADAQMRMGAFEAAATTFGEMGDRFAEGGFNAKAVAMYKQARTVVQQHLAQRADQFAHLLPKLARLYQDQGLTGEALIIYDEYAGILERAGRARDALDVIRQLAELRKDDGRLRARLIDALIAAGELESAMAELMALAGLLASSGRRDEAIQVYERVFAYRADPVLARTIADLYLDRGVPGDGIIALNRLQACFQSTQRDPETLRVLARALEAVGQRAKATEIRKLLLRILLDAGDDDACRELVSRLLVESPTDENVRRTAVSLGMIENPLPRPSNPVDAPAPEVVVSEHPASPSPSPAHVEDSYNLEELEPESFGNVRYEEEAFDDLGPPDDDAVSPPHPKPSEEFAFVGASVGLEDTFSGLDYDDFDIDSPHPDPPPLRSFGEPRAPVIPAYDLDEPPEDTLRAPSPSPAEDEESVAAVLEEVAFYESQNLLDDALSLIEEYIPNYPNHPALLEQWRHLRAALGLPTS